LGGRLAGSWTRIFVGPRPIMGLAGEALGGCGHGVGITQLLVLVAVRLLTYAQPSLPLL